MQKRPELVQRGVGPLGAFACSDAPTLSPKLLLLDSLTRWGLQEVLHCLKRIEANRVMMCTTEAQNSMAAP